MKYHRIDANLRRKKRHNWNEPVLWPVVVCLIALMAGLVPAVVAYRKKERGAGIGNLRERGENV
jgi:hypothetical protein